MSYYQQIGRAGRGAVNADVLLLRGSSNVRWLQERGLFFNDSMTFAIWSIVQPSGVGHERH